MKSTAGILERTRTCLSLAWLLFHRDFQYRYRQAYLGYLWALARPMLQGVPLIIVGKQFDLGGGGPVAGSYEAYCFVGLVFWQVFWDCVVYPQLLTRRTRQILKRASLNPFVLVLASCGYVAFNALVYLVLLAAVLMVFKVKVGILAALGLLGLLSVAVAGLGLGMLIVPASLIYLDIRYSFSVIASVLLLSAPIIYVRPESGLLCQVNLFNPLTYLIDVPRSWVLDLPTSGAWLFVACAAAGIAGFFASFKLYSRAMPRVCDYVL